MTKRFDRIDGFLGRIVFRGFGLLCAVTALGCGYAFWWQVTHRESGSSLVPAVLFGLAALGAGSAVPYCFSRKRTFAEALDAMEGGVGDQPRRR